jgi:septal ring factor EnvC (AmiA/AmiB activator)
VGGSFAQTNPSRDELQKQEQGLRKELDELNELKNQIQKNKKTTLAQLNVIKSKIAKREALVNGIAKQVALIDNTIATNQKDVSRLNSELDTLKSRYAKSISFAYKNRSGYEYLNFLFSANSFNDAVKRITYLKNYRQNREAQAKTIALSQLDLNDKISQLGLNKKDRVVTLNVQSDQLKVLVDDRKEQDKIISQLKGKEKEVTAQLKQKEAQRKKMQAALMSVIKREMAEAEKKEKERKAKFLQKVRESKWSDEKKQQKLAEYHQAEMKRQEKFLAKQQKEIDKKSIQEARAKLIDGKKAQRKF